MGTWKGITFLERGEGGSSFPGWARAADISTRHVPGGNGSIIQSTGLVADTLSLNVLVTAAQLASLRANTGLSGALSFSDTSATAILMSIGSPQKVANN